MHPRDLCATITTIKWGRYWAAARFINKLALPDEGIVDVSQMKHESVPLENCDVRDKERLAVYRDFRTQWIEMLNGDDYHAISDQIRALLDADLKFRTINFARQLCEEADLPQNGMVHSFIDRGFIAHQAFAIRRLTEKYHGPNRKNAVYSLPRVISEIEEKRDIITREMYVCAEADPYNCTGHVGHGIFRHESFDELSQVDRAARSRDDLIHPDCFRKLRSRLKSSDLFRTYANKLLAHAADPVTRKGNEGFDFKDLDSAYNDLIWLTNQLSVKLLYGPSRVFLPLYRFNVLKHIENGLCPAPKLQERNHFWSKRHKELKKMECANARQQNAEIEREQARELDAS